MFFFESFEKRTLQWAIFRNELEKSNDPFQDVIDFWNKAPISYRTCDPFDQKTWLEPWNLLEENNYCEFSKILAIYYTLVLTDRFKNCYFEIQIINDKNAHELRYILIVDDLIIGYFYNRSITHNELPSDIIIQASYPMLRDFS